MEEITGTETETETETGTGTETTAEMEAAAQALLPVEVVLQQQVTALQLTVNLKDEVIANRDIVITTCNEMIASRDAIITASDATIAARDNTIAEQASVIAARDATIAEKELELVQFAGQAERYIVMESQLLDAQAEIGNLQQRLLTETTSGNYDRLTIGWLNSALYARIRDFDAVDTSNIRTNLTMRDIDAVKQSYSTLLLELDDMNEQATVAEQEEMTQLFMECGFML